MKFISERSRLSAERVRRVLHYDPMTGAFTRRERTHPANKFKVGTAAGTLTKKGYVQIMVGGERHGAHRLAVLYMTGKWPVAQVDHENLNKSDNRWSNLREATNGQNKANGPVYRCTMSGLKGAYWEGRRGKWGSKIRKDGLLRHVGYFDTAAEAHEAWKRAAANLHGEFARAA